MPTWLIVVLVIVVLIVLWFIATYNKLVVLRNKVKDQWAQIDTVLKRRFDLIPNLVETVKGYAKHESETLENVVSARNKALSSATPADKAAAEKEFAGTLSRLLALTEAYPDLKANQNFIDLQKDLTSMEGEIANARKYYNAVVKTFNTLVDKFPSNIIANMFNFSKQPMFAVTNETERDSVKVQF